MDSQTLSSFPNVVPRRLVEDFPQNIKRFWFDDSPFLTRMMDAYTLLVPDNEQYYMRTIQKCIIQIKNPELKNQVLRFFRQEGQHGIAHKKYWENLRGQNLPIGGFIKPTNFLLYNILEPITPLKLKISIVTFIEYINSYLGNIFLSKKLLNKATPSMRKLFEWHFAEEIEHKAVAFDVYQNISGSYFLRTLAGLLVFPMFYFLNMLGTIYLLYCDRKLFSRLTWRDALNHFFFKDRVFFITLEFFLQYLKPSFHPWQIKDYELAEKFFINDESSVIEILSDSPLT